MMMEEVFRNKKNITGLILSLACEEVGDVGDAVRYLRNRLYNDSDIFQIFEVLVSRKARIESALRGGN
ncbi:hypothetical protein ES707_18570 [subsurface metagenome]